MQTIAIEVLRARGPPRGTRGPNAASAKHRHCRPGLTAAADELHSTDRHCIESSSRQIIREPKRPNDQAARTAPRPQKMLDGAFFVSANARECGIRIKECKASVGSAIVRAIPLSHQVYRGRSYRRRKHCGHLPHVFQHSRSMTPA